MGIGYLVTWIYQLYLLYGGYVVDTYLDTNRLDGWMVMVVIIEYHMAHVTRRPNTNMPNLVWLVVVVIKHISYIIWPMRRPNTNMLISVWMDVDGGHYWILHGPCHKTQYQHDEFIVWMVVVVIIEQHMAYAKTQYQYVKLSMAHFTYWYWVLAMSYGVI